MSVVESDDDEGQQNPMSGMGRQNERAFLLVLLPHPEWCFPTLKKKSFIEKRGRSGVGQLTWFTNRITIFFDMYSKFWMIDLYCSNDA